MSRWILFGLVLLLSTVPGVAVASGDGAPFVNAGLDQTVEQNTTVYLDGGGSYDPDGEITEHSWHIETPSGDETTPSCADCTSTRFRPDQAGRYNVSLRVTDDDGNTRTDSLYVTVDARHEPSITLSGSDSADSGTNLTYNATATAGDANLSSLTWATDGTFAETITADGQQSTDSYTFEFTGQTNSVSVTVTDIDGQQASDRINISQDSGGSLANFDYRRYGANIKTTSAEDFGDKQYDLEDKTVYTDFNGDGEVNVEGENIDSRRVTEVETEEKTVVYSGKEDNKKVNYGSIY